MLHFWRTVVLSTALYSGLKISHPLKPVQTSHHGKKQLYNSQLYQHIPVWNINTLFCWARISIRSSGNLPIHTPVSTIVCHLLIPRAGVLVAKIGIVDVLPDVSICYPKQRPDYLRCWEQPSRRLQTVWRRQRRKWVSSLQRIEVIVRSEEVRMEKLGLLYTPEKIDATQHCVSQVMVLNISHWTCHRTLCPRWEMEQKFVNVGGRDRSITWRCICVMELSRIDTAIVLSTSSLPPLGPTLTASIFFDTLHDVACTI